MKAGRLKASGLIYFLRSHLITVHTPDYSLTEEEREIRQDAASRIF